MSSLTFPCIITLLILPLISSTEYIYDFNEDPIKNGKEYFISLSLEYGREYSITPFLSEDKENTKCPLFIAREMNGGTPVRISTPTKKTYISRGDPVNFAFVDPTGRIPCNGSLEWKLGPRSADKREHFTVGGSGSSGLEFAPFLLISLDKYKPFVDYVLVYCDAAEACYNVGFFNDDLLLGITEYPILIRFQPASDDEVSAS